MSAFYKCHRLQIENIFQNPSLGFTISGMYQSGAWLAQYCPIPVYTGMYWISRKTLKYQKSRKRTLFYPFFSSPFLVIYNQIR